MKYTYSKVGTVCAVAGFTGVLAVYFAVSYVNRQTMWRGGPVLGRNPQQGARGQSEREHIASLDKVVDAAMERRDYTLAESTVREIAKLEGDPPMRYFELGNILFDAGNREGARLAYKQYFEGSTVGVHDFLLLTKYGDLAYDAGDSVSARIAYSRAITGSSKGLPFPLSRPSDVTPLRELRATAISCSAQFYRGQPTKYLDETARAIESDPNSSVARFTHADALYVLGRFADSRKEFDVALSLSSKDQARDMARFVGQFYGFQKMDHTTTAVVHADGSVTFTKRKIELPNNRRVQAKGDDSPNRQIRP